MFAETKLRNLQNYAKRFYAPFTNRPLRVTKHRFFMIIRKRFPVNSHDIRPASPGSLFCNEAGRMMRARLCTAAKMAVNMFCMGDQLCMCTVVKIGYHCALDYVLYSV